MWFNFACKGFAGLWLSGKKTVIAKRSQALFTSHPNPKYFLFHPSHQIFRRMHEALNVGKKDN
jgi:hypothetical protein